MQKISFLPKLFLNIYLLMTNLLRDKCVHSFLFMEMKTNEFLSEQTNLVIADVL